MDLDNLFYIKDIQTESFENLLDIELELLELEQLKKRGEK